MKTSTIARSLKASLAQFYGKPDIDIRELKSQFPEAVISLVLALDFNKDLFKNIVYEYNFSGGAYGVFDPKETQKTKEELLNALQYRQKDVEDIGKNVFGVSFGVNMGKIKEIAQNKTKKIVQELEKLMEIQNIKGFNNLWKAIAVIEAASTMVHEATHAMSPEMKEAAAESAEKQFINWVKQEGKNRVEKILEDLHIDTQLADIIKKMYA